MTLRILAGTAMGTALLALLFIARTTPAGYTRIELGDEAGGAPVLSAVLTDGEEVTLRWLNSQFGLPVREVFRVREGLLIQERVTFFTPEGSQPPRVSPEDVADLYHTGGPFDAEGFSRPFSRIVYRIGEIGDPRLGVRNRTVSLAEKAGFGGRMILTAARPTVGEIARHKLLEFAE